MINQLKFLYIVFSVAFVLYLAIPTFGFPVPPQDALRSIEPGDNETPLRQAYFTNFSRQEVMDHYQKVFTKSTFFSISLPTYRLNYPPEEAKVLIRDQTRSTFLEEVVHPFRESIYVNGFEPKEAKDAIYIAGRPWRQKISVKIYPSSVVSRVIIGIVTLWFCPIVIRNFWSALVAFKSKHV